MSQADLLLLLWDALQHRETTIGQVLDLSSACGLDGPWFWPITFGVNHD